MPRNLFRFPKPTHELLTGRKIHYRKEFKDSVKKIEWNKAAGRDDDDFKTTSKCRHCPMRFVWGKGGYNFDHKDNNSANNSQRNCHLVCAVCHGRDTRIGKRAVKVMGIKTGKYKTIKYKTGYKKSHRIKKKRRKPSRKQTSFGGTWKLPKMPKGKGFA